MDKEPKHVSKHLVAAIAAVGLLSLNLAACAADPEPEGSTTEHLDIAIIAPDGNSSVAYSAMLTGAFEDEDLEVTFVPAGATTFQTLLAAGRADAAMGGLATAISFAQQGKPTKSFYNYVSSATGGVMWGGKGITDPGQCRNLVSGLANTFQYGYAVYYKETLGLDYEITPGDPTVSAPGLKSGTFDCATGNAGVFGSLLSTGDATILINPKTDLPIPAPVGGTIWGLASRVDEKHEALVRFVRAMNSTWETTFNNGDYDPAEIAALLKQSPDYDPYTLAALTDVMTQFEGYLNPEDGIIPEDQWLDTLNFLKNYVGNADIDPDDPALAYDKLVDASIYEDAESAD